MALGDVVADLRAFHDIPPPKEPPEFRAAAWLTRGLTYASLAFPVLLPALVLLMVGFGRLTMSEATRNSTLIFAIVAAVPTFVLLARSYPAFVAGERWAQLAIALVGLGLLALTPFRFLREAASRPGIVAIPPTPAEWTVFFAALLFLYLILCEETRHGMSEARARHAVPTPDRAPEATVVAARPLPPPALPEPDTADLDDLVGTAGTRRAAAPPPVRYTCPRCTRIYTMSARPPAGTLCPSCRAAVKRS